MLRNIIIALIVTIALYSCNDKTVGYLELANAEFAPDSLVIKTTLDPVEDADRIELQYPWVSTKIQGVLGTRPIFYMIENVYSETGDVSRFLEKAEIRGDGAFEIPLEHGIPQGEYKIDLRVYNEGYSEVLSSAFRIIVK